MNINSHGFYDISSSFTRFQASKLTIRLGEFDIDSNSEPQSYVEKNCEEIVIHPKYTPQSDEKFSAIFSYDLALLKLKGTVSFSPLVIPICIPDDINDLVGKNGWITGWGAQYGKNF